MNAPGRVITFYSYKGGTGRTMAMANVAWILASNGHRVLVIDWDLEAPGLHRFLGPALSDADQKSTNGLIDFLMEYVLAATRGKQDPPGGAWYESYTNIIRFAQPVSTGFPEGRLDMIGPGRQNADYAERVNMFDWRSFYDRFKGRAFLDAVFAKLRDKYDFILIDSRTGVSDTSGICTVHLPDALVVMFTMNIQSIDGASGVALDARRQREDKLEVYPVPTRIELAEIDRLQAARAVARSRFVPIVHALDAPGSDYLEDMSVPHVAYYLYEEQLAAIVEAGRARVLLGLYEKLAAYVSGGSVTRLVLLPEKELDAARARFRSGKVPGSAATARLATPKRYDVFLSYSERDHAIALPLRKELSNLMSVFDPSSDIKAGQNLMEATREAIQSSTAVVVLVAEASTSTPPRWLELDIAVAKEFDILVIPVLIRAAKAPDSLLGLAPIRATVNEPGPIAEQIRSAMLARDRDGRSANERIAFLFAERNRLEGQTARLRRLQIGWIAVAVVLLSFSIAGIASYWRQRNRLEDANKEAEAAGRLKKEAETKLLDAENERDRYQAVSDALQKSYNVAQAGLIDAKEKSDSLESDFKYAVKTQEALRAQIQQLTKSAGNDIKSSESGPLVLVFASPGDTEQDAVQFAATALENQKFLLGSKRIYAGRPPNGVTEVRYFRNPEDRDEAKQILEILESSAHLSDGRISFVIDPDIKRARYFEVRLAKAAFPGTTQPKAQ